MHSRTYLIVNFGGPRTLKEVEPFLKALLTDRDVVRTSFPQVFHNYVFNKIAQKRAVKVEKDYEEIGGSSPIYADTEYVAQAIRSRVEGSVLTFHRYLPATHLAALEAIEKTRSTEIRVFPMFPQFTYATTGSIARFFQQHLSPKTVQKLRWIKSYPTHSAFIQVIQRMIREFLEEKGLKEEETILLFSAHGVPRKFIETGDLYEYECRSSVEKVMEGFPLALGRLSFQSKFGPGEWLRPYTEDVCQEIELWSHGKQNFIFVPISFTSDHLETLFEVEKQYLPIIQAKGLTPFRLPAPNRRGDWIEAITTMLQDFSPVSNSMLVRRN